MASPKKAVQKGLHLHRIQPILFGGNPADLKNIKLITRKEHAEVSVFWNNVVKDVKGNK